MVERKNFYCLLSVLLLVLYVFSTPSCAMNWVFLMKDHSDSKWYLQTPPYKKQSSSSYVVLVKVVYSPRERKKLQESFNLPVMPIQHTVWHEYKFDGSKTRPLTAVFYFADGSTETEKYPNDWLNISPEAISYLIWSRTHKERMK